MSFQDELFSICRTRFQGRNTELRQHRFLEIVGEMNSRGLMNSSVRLKKVWNVIKEELDGSYEELVNTSQEVLGLHQGIYKKEFHDSVNHIFYHRVEELKGLQREQSSGFLPPESTERFLNQLTLDDKVNVLQENLNLKVDTIFQGIEDSKGKTTWDRVVLRLKDNKVTVLIGLVFFVVTYILSILVNIINLLK